MENVRAVAKKIITVLNDHQRNEQLENQVEQFFDVHSFWLIDNDGMRLSSTWIRNDFETRISILRGIALADDHPNHYKVESTSNCPQP